MILGAEVERMQKKNALNLGTDIDHVRSWGRKVIREFEHGMVASARWAGLSISGTSGLLGFSHSAVSGVSSLRSKKSTQ